MTDTAKTKKTPGSPFDLRRALSHRLLPLIYALAAVVAVILIVTWVALSAQVNVAGFLNAESLWSKAQKEAIIAIGNYAVTGKASDYANFKRNNAVQQADRWIRDAVRRPHYDHSKVDAAFARGHVMPSARSAMIFTMRYLYWAPYVDEALAAWRASDEPAEQLVEVATGLQAAYASGQATPQLIASARSRIHHLNAIIGPQTDAFSLTLAEGAAWFARLLFKCVLGAALTGCLLWLWMARRVYVGIRGSQERYRLLFESAPDAILILEAASGRILAANRIAEAWWGEDPQRLAGMTYKQWSEQCALQEITPDDHILLAQESPIRPVEIKTIQVKWGDKTVSQVLVRDVSERVERERTDRIAAAALASIKEGVTLIDASRRVVSVNAAACTITGFHSLDLVGTQFGDSRTLPDGSSLTATMWSVIALRGHWSGEVRNCNHNGAITKLFTTSQCSAIFRTLRELARDWSISRSTIH